MQKKVGRKPKIIVSRTDHDRLLGLATAMEEHDPVFAETMIAELERARVVEDSALPETVVRMGSTLTYTADEAPPTTVTLVFPVEADITEGKISVTTPVGAVLVGLSAGQSIDWTARNGRTHRLTVTDVRQPVKKAS
ncbi:nucleoside diphosphate kinase regulator [Chelativorans salis]|uniref:Nucleoside diphosphate kinase regulator n=1 Tax=Chelativorans salis TaxID=2978478 RepID=A0ABT2LJZ6_9HYPH|nr:nucleoside diphosphate kinase regulator [Chelativorans sp. EGI FJ00035]MCT7374747.1 nucleoside diphosphate kinase regulator [Chelativorans sp. EGI FJ00035]